jgi:hypothetical protein
LATINSSVVSTGIAIFVVLFVFLWTCPSIRAQTDIAFSPADKFSIPLYDSTISFGVDGTYSKATFENDTWTFRDLRLNGSQLLENFTISAQNSNVTIFFYQTFNAIRFQFALLGYVAEGQGKQILNLGLGSVEGGLSASVEWGVVLGNNVFLAEGDGWSISRDGTIVVAGKTGNVTIVHYGFLDSYGNNLLGSNLPLYQQHSVAIVIAVAVSVTVVIAVVIKVKSREHSSEGELVNSAPKLVGKGLALNKK